MTKREVVLTVGIVVAAIGLMCLPVGFVVSPKRSLSVFSALADTGAFLKLGLGLLVSGIVITLVARLLPDD